MDGANRRPMAGPLMEIFEMLDGREVAIIGDPPALVFDAPERRPAAARRPTSSASAAGRCSGARAAGWVRPGLRRFDGDVHLEAGRIRLDDGSVATVALGDLERFA